MIRYKLCDMDLEIDPPLTAGLLCFSSYLIVMSFASLPSPLFFMRVTTLYHSERNAL